MDGPRLLLVGRPSPTLDNAEKTLAAVGLEVVRVLPAKALSALDAAALRGAVVLVDSPESSSVAGAIAARGIAVLALEPPREGGDPAALARTAEAFARHLVGPKASKGAFARLRMAVLTERWDKSEALVRGLRAAGAMVATAEPSARGASTARSIEPHVVLLDVAPAAEGLLVQELSADPVLQFSVILPFEWEALDDGTGGLRLQELLRIVEGWIEPERELVAGALKSSEWMSLETVGVARALRALADMPEPVRAHVHGRAGRTMIDLANGMVVGASFEPAHGSRTGGPAALAAALSLEGASVRCERFEEPMEANVATSASDALKAGRLLQAALADDLPTDPNVRFHGKPLPSSEGSFTLRLMLGALAPAPPPEPEPVAPEPVAPEPIAPIAPISQPIMPAPALTMPASVEEPDGFGDSTSPAEPPPLELPKLLTPPPPPPPRSVPPIAAPVRSAPPRAKRPPILLITLLALVIGFGGASAALWWVKTRADARVAVAQRVVPPSQAQPLPAKQAPPPIPVPPPEIPPAQEDPPQQEVSPDPTPEPEPVEPPAQEAEPESPTPEPEPVEPAPVEVQAPLEPGAEPAWLAAVRPALHGSMSPSDLNRLAPRNDDQNAARIESDAIATRAQALLRERQYANAERLYQEAFLACPHNPHVAAALAEFYLARDRPRVAVLWARTAHQLRPGRPEYSALVDRAEAASHGQAEPAPAPEEAP